MRSALAGLSPQAQGRAEAAEGRLARYSWCRGLQAVRAFRRSVWLEINVAKLRSKRRFDVYQDNADWIPLTEKDSFCAFRVS